MSFIAHISKTLLLLTLGVGTAVAQAPPDTAPAVPAQQTRFDIHIDGINAVQLAWWFQHLADDNGKWWKPLAPGQNRSIVWKANPREDVHQLIGAVYSSIQDMPAGLFAGDKLTAIFYFGDYVTQNRNRVPGQPVPLNPTLPYPRDYVAPYPTPPFVGPTGMAGRLNTQDNGFNEDMLLLDGMGFAPGRLLWSWRNTGNDDTPATANQPRSIDLSITVYQPWMEGANRPPALHQDGYYYSPAQVQAIWSSWETMLKAMPQHLPKWFGTDTQDDLARSKNFIVTSVIDTGFVEGVDSRMMFWWWNHAMGDAPGVAYTLWAPPAHFSIRWLPGYSPADVLKSDKIPTDRVIPGVIYPDLQGGSVEQTGGGMMSFPVEKSPIPGVYKTLNLMIPVTKQQVDSFSSVRFPDSSRWLLHQWEDRKGGIVHRSTSVAALPLQTPLTQQAFYFEHQLVEGQWWGSQAMRHAYQAWLQDSKGHP